jgi:hypothetical protein
MQFTIASLQVVIIAGIASLQLAAGTPINIGMAMDKGWVILPVYHGSSMSLLVRRRIRRCAA